MENQNSVWDELSFLQRSPDQLNDVRQGGGLALQEQETTQATPETVFKNFAGIDWTRIPYTRALCDFPDLSHSSELTDIPDAAGLYDFSKLSHSSVNLSSTSVTHQEEDCALPMELAGQPVPGQPHCIAAADNEMLSSSHQGRQKDFEDQHRDLGKESASSYADEKTIWQSQLKSYMYSILDFGILEIKKQPTANLDKIYAKMNEDFTYSPYPLNKDVMYKYIRYRLRDLRSKWKKKWEVDRVYKPTYCPEAAWKTLIEHLGTEEVMAEAEKMKKARAAVKNPSHVGRGGRKYMS